MELGKSIINLIEESVCHIRRNSWHIIDSSISSGIMFNKEYNNAYSNQIWQSVSEPIINSSIRLAYGYR